jgi:hypothetical protein
MAENAKTPTEQDIETAREIAASMARRGLIFPSVEGVVASELAAALAAQREELAGPVDKEIAFEESFIGDEHCPPQEQEKHRYCAGILKNAAAAIRKG